MQQPTNVAVALIDRHAAIIPTTGSSQDSTIPVHDNDTSGPNLNSDGSSSSSNIINDNYSFYTDKSNQKRVSNAAVGVLNENGGEKRTTAQEKRVQFRELRYPTQYGSEDGDRQLINRQTPSNRQTDVDATTAPNTTTTNTTNTSSSNSRKTSNGTKGNGKNLSLAELVETARNNADKLLTPPQQ